MAKPLVAIVGRPNVGKSTFFNKASGRRISIIEDTPGVTRDRVYADVEWAGKAFTLIDTGGIDPKTDDVLLKQMRRQAEIAIETADVILFFCDGREGQTADDLDVANMLRRSKKPVLLVINKIDVRAQSDNVYDFYTLGLGDPIAISSVNMLGLGDLLDEIVKLLPKSDDGDDENEQEPIQVALVGRPNVGKSSLTNKLLGQERTMVSDIPGTTRDAIDTMLVSANGKRYNIIDTAGIRRKRAVEDESLEKYSVLRSIAAIGRCDVALILVDAADGVTEQDTKIAGMVHEEGKAAVIVVNKWDSIDKDTGTMEKKRREVLEALKFMDYAPVVFISALTGQRVDQVLKCVDDCYEQSRKHVSMGALNDVLQDAQAQLQPPVMGGRRLKIFYMTQVAVAPPTFVMFVNDGTLMHFAYQRFLENQIRKAFGFAGTPVRFIIRNKDEKDE
ncbi:MAG: ribosome biogenesis GTPase Der [Eubacteriales bacterium]|nr:ribosome biogenesis GTPase Der [Eubacteriales bacterium]MDD3880643.1 ribosome biogenesis GTPase Der [Eubacteriales bacterium]MDD4513549.1 ribosome biogenesis GTPase Der [Eubacteriales bacterium]